MATFSFGGGHCGTRAGGKVVGAVAEMSIKLGGGKSWK